MARSPLRRAAGAVAAGAARRARRNPDRDLVTGVVCGVRVEEVADPFMREVRIIDKLVDELAKGRPIERILRSRLAASAPLRVGGGAPRPPTYPAAAGPP